VDKALELIGLDNLSSRGICWLLIVAGEFFKHVFADIAVLFFDFGTNFCGITSLELFATVLERLKHVLGNIVSSERNMLHARWDHISVANREDVSDTIAWVDDCASHVTDIVQITLVALITCICELCIERKRRLHTDKQALHVKSLEHNFCHLFTVLGSV